MTPEFQEGLEKIRLVTDRSLLAATNFLATMMKAELIEGDANALSEDSLEADGLFIRGLLQLRALEADFIDSAVNNNKRRTSEVITFHGMDLRKTFIFGALEMLIQREIIRVSIRDDKEVVTINGTTYEMPLDSFGSNLTKVINALYRSNMVNPRTGEIQLSQIWSQRHPEADFPQQDR